MQIRKFVTIFPLLCSGLLFGCPGKSAKQDLDLARQALADARAQNANDCAAETFAAAEQALEEASKLEESGEAEQATAKAQEAAVLAAQAQRASPKGCNEKKEVADETDEPTFDTGATQEVAVGVNVNGTLETVYFDFNDSTIREDSKVVLEKLAGLLGEKPGQKIEVEGHCDVRGSTEFNLHLGERRARSVKKYLMAQGVRPEQVDIISYGEERPVDLGGSENSHQQNRRAELKPNP